MQLLRTRLSRTVSVLVGAAALAAALAGAVPAAPAGATDGRTFLTMLAQLRGCESGGNYAINTGNGYYGAYQFDAGTWRSVGGTGLPHQNPPAVQDEMATRLYEQRGWSPWPSCSRSLGLHPVPVQRPNTGVAPVGAVDSVTGQGGGIRITGWAFDRDTVPAGTVVHVYVDGVGAGVLPADKPRPDVSAAFGVGVHGVDGVVPAAPGRRQVCVFAINTGPAGDNTLLECRETVVPSLPVGALDSAVRTGKQVRVTGWTLDMDTPARSTVVHVYVDGRLVRAARADEPRPDVASALGVPRRRGFDVTVPAGAQVCVYGIDTGGAGNPAVGCAAPA